MPQIIKSNKKSVIENFRDGKIGLFPTDTAFGIGCRMDNVNSVKKVFEIRNRPKEKAVLVLVSSTKMAQEYLEVIPKDVYEKILNKYWPGGVTVILKCQKNKVPEIVRSGGDTLAVRLPDHNNLVAIIKELGVPIIAPSANISGGKTPHLISEIAPDIKENIDFVVEGVCTMDGVSTIIDCSVKEWKIIRQGVVRINI